MISIANFDSPISPPLAEVGGKALSLIEMTKAGLPVPTGCVLTVAFFEPWIKRLEKSGEWASLQKALSEDVDLEQSTADLKIAAKSLKFYKKQQTALTEALAFLPQGALFAVRSSSPEEDLAGASSGEDTRPRWVSRNPP